MCLELNEHIHGWILCTLCNVLICVQDFRFPITCISPLTQVCYGIFKFIVQGYKWNKLRYNSKLFIDNAENKCFNLSGKLWQVVSLVLFSVPSYKTPIHLRTVENSNLILSLSTRYIIGRITILKKTKCVTTLCKIHS